MSTMLSDEDQGASDRADSEAAQWARILTNCPTACLHDALIKREGVSAEFLGPEDSKTLRVTGACWVIINRD